MVAMSVAWIVTDIIRAEDMEVWKARKRVQFKHWIINEEHITRGSHTYCEIQDIAT